MPVAAAIGAVAAVAGLFGSRSAAKAAKRAAAIEAKNERIATEERIFQISQEERTLAGVTQARQAGAGFITTQGSILNILAEQANQFERERRVTSRVGASKVAQALASGKAVAAQYNAQGVSNLLQGLGQAALLAENAGFFAKAPKG